jgi:hypothetical protein
MLRRRYRALYSRGSRLPQRGAGSPSGGARRTVGTAAFTAGGSRFLAEKWCFTGDMLLFTGDKLRFTGAKSRGTRGDASLADDTRLFPSLTVSVRAGEAPRSHNESAVSPKEPNALVVPGGCLGQAVRRAKVA